MNNEITLTDLFEVEMLQRLQDSFCKMTGFAAIITDAEGVPVTKGTNFTDFCNKYTRNSPIGRQHILLDDLNPPLSPFSFLWFSEVPPYSLFCLGIG